MGDLGFRELAKFNEALLAKQGWRLMHHKSSLFCRVFKAKFFPNCSWLEANPKQRGSYAWRSIMKSLHVIQKWSRRRIGDGNNTTIWICRWLPTSHSFKCFSPIKTLPKDSLVSPLIEGPQQRWSDKLIDDIFHPREAAIIKSIPLSDSPSPDQLIWTRTNNSIFSVKSAYHLLVEESRQGSTSCSDTGCEILEGALYSSDSPRSQAFPVESMC